jgi:CubicO group peptidase (beta-lactamase class C family)
MSRSVRFLVLGLSLLTDHCASNKQVEAPAPPAPQATLARVPQSAVSTTIRSAVTESESRTDTPAPSPPRHAKLEAVLPEIADWLLAQQTSSRTPALAFGVVVDDQLYFKKGYGVRDVRAGGDVDENTVFRIGSITKVFTALAVRKLAEDGIIELDTPAEHYLPELAKLAYPKQDTPRISVRQLLTHSAGLPRNTKALKRTNGDIERALLNALNGLAFEYAPGTDYRYSNLSYQLLGLLVARSAKTSLQDYLQRLLFEPLEMKQTVWSGFDVQDTLAIGYTNVDKTPKRIAVKRFGAVDGDGGLYSSVADLAKFASFELKAARGADDASPVSINGATLRDSQQIAFAGKARLSRTALTAPNAPTRDVGLYWLIQKDADFDHLVYHSGVVNGYRASLGLLPTRGIAVIVLLNSDSLDAEALMQQVAKRLIAAETHEPAPDAASSIVP